MFPYRLCPRTAGARHFDAGGGARVALTRSEREGGIGISGACTRGTPFRDGVRLDEQHRTRETK